MCLTLIAALCSLVGSPFKTCNPRTKTLLLGPNLGLSFKCNTILSLPFHFIFSVRNINWVLIRASPDYEMIGCVDTGVLMQIDYFPEMNAKVVVWQTCYWSSSRDCLLGPPSHIFVSAYEYKRYWSIPTLGCSQVLWIYASLYEYLPVLVCLYEYLWVLRPGTWRPVSA